VFNGEARPAQTRKVAANQAWWEYQPARVKKPSGPSLETFDPPHVTDTPITVPDTPLRMVEIACDRQTIRLSVSRVNGGSAHAEVALVIE
jgi:hypothetical protein